MDNNDPTKEAVLMLVARLTSKMANVRISRLTSYYADYFCQIEQSEDGRTFNFLSEEKCIVSISFLDGMFLLMDGKHLNITLFEDGEPESLINKLSGCLISQGNDDGTYVLNYDHQTNHFIANSPVKTNISMLDARELLKTKELPNLTLAD